MSDVKQKHQYGIDIAKPGPSRTAESARKGAEKEPNAVPLKGEALVKAGQDLMENGA